MKKDKKDLVTFLEYQKIPVWMFTYTDIQNNTINQLTWRGLQREKSFKEYRGNLYKSYLKCSTKVHGYFIIGKYRYFQFKENNLTYLDSIDEIDWEMGYIAKVGGFRLYPYSKMCSFGNVYLRLYYDLEDSDLEEYCNLTKVAKSDENWIHIFGE